MRLLVVATVLPLLTAALANCEEPATLSVEVEVRLRGPDGQTLSHKSATFTVTEAEAFAPKTLPVTATTNENGIAKLRAPAGVYAFAISVPGVGYGGTGTEEFVSGRFARPHVPPLVPFGSVAGKLLPDSCKSGATVLIGYSFPRDRKISAKPGRDGRFQFTDLEAENWYAWAEVDGIRCAELGHAIHLAPGQQIQNVLLKAIPAIEYGSKTETTVTGSNSGNATTGREPTSVWAEGTVRDERGQPIANATVYALGTYFGGIRMYETTAQATTDQQGRYELRGSGSLSEFSLTLVASAPGKGPAWAWPEVRQPASWERRSYGRSQDAPPRQDFVLSSHSGKLRVTVLQDGRPVARASVAVYLENANLRDMWAAGARDRAKIEDVAHPAALTGPDGVAQFDDLPPGMYWVIAAPGSKDDIRAETLGFMGLSGSQKPYAFARGVAVQTGNTTKFRLAIYPQDTRSSFVIHRPDGSPLRGKVGLNFGPISSLGTGTSIPLDPSGRGTEEFRRPGLWHVEATYRASPVTGFPFRPPYYAALGEVAVSPSLVAGTPPVFTARRFSCGSLQVHVLDEKGEPIHAVVKIYQGSTQFASINLQGSTDKEGKIRFEGVPPFDHYIVRAFPDGTEPLDPEDASPVAARLSRFRMHLEVLPEEVAVASNEEAALVLRRELVGYLYGTIKAPPGFPDLRYVRTGGNEELLGVSYAVMPDTGEYLAGPFRAGSKEMFLLSDDPEHGSATAKILGTIRAGDVTRSDVEKEQWIVRHELTRTSDWIHIGASGASTQTIGAHNLTGGAWMHDAKTAAFGAQVFYFEPGQASPTIVAMADALGNLRPRNIPQNANASRQGEKVGPSAPVLVAFLPGTCGGIVQPAPKLGDPPVKLVLPPPHSQTGRVTVGGHVLRRGAGNIRILAAYRGESFLAPWLSVETNADADGYFALNGLSPGRYEIQAVLDDIWLSAPVTIEVNDPGHAPTPVHLRIAAPGAPVVIRVRDENGNAREGIAIELDRTGPLAGLWPQEWVSDGAGVIYFPTLESGGHILRSKHLSKPLVIKVPPLPAEPPLTLSITLPRGH